MTENILKKDIMKKFLLLTAVAVALSLTGCVGNDTKDYKSKGEEMAKQLDEQVEKQDTTSALASDDAIRKMEDELAASGDSLALAQFREAMKDSRVRNATFITLSKMENGMSKDDALKELAGDALKGDVNINAVTAVIDAINRKEVLENKK